MGPWTLYAGDGALGRLTYRENEMWNVRCHFTPTPAFDAWRARFEEKSRLAEALESSDGETPEFDALEDATSPPHLTLRTDDGADFPFGLLYVEGDFAGFRGL